MLSSLHTKTLLKNGRHAPFTSADAQQQRSIHSVRVHASTPINHRVPTEELLMVAKKAAALGSEVRGVPLLHQGAFRSKRTLMALDPCLTGMPLAVHR